jgi:hypothetical protein
MITAERLDRDALAAVQGRRLAELVAAIYGRNAFYTQKLDAAGCSSIGCSSHGISRSCR